MRPAMIFGIVAGDAPVIVFRSGEKQPWSSDRKYNNLSQQDSDCDWIMLELIHLFMIYLFIYLNFTNIYYYDDDDDDDYYYY